MQKCVWSGIKSSEVIEIVVTIRNMLGFGQKEKSFWVLPQFEQEFRVFAKINFERGPRFVGFILSTIVLMHIIILLVSTGVFTKNMLLVSLGSLIMAQGMLILIYPHTNLDQAQVMSLKTAKKVGVGVSVFVILTGLALMVASFFSENPL